MTKNEFALTAVAITAAGLTLFAWHRWSRAEAVAQYYRSTYYKTCLTAAAGSGATLELALDRCQDNDVAVKVWQYLP